MLEVKLSIPGAPRDADLSQYVGNPDNVVENCRLTVNSPTEAADVWFVIEGTEPNDLTCTASAAVFLGAEQVWGTGHLSESATHQRYLRTFDHIFTTQDLFWSNVTHTYPFLPWMINARHGEPVLIPDKRDVNALRALDDVPKSATLSVICSHKTYSAGHRLRLRFVEALAAELGDDLHWYGSGIREAPTKWDAIAPYRYHLVLENQSVYSSFSEKIYDSFLGLAYPVYWGAPNLGDYFDRRAFTPIDIRDLKGSLRTIIAVIESDAQTTRHEVLMEAKQRTLGEHNMFVRIARIAQSLATTGLPPRRLVSLPQAPKDPSLSRRGLTALGRALKVEIN